MSRLSQSGGCFLFQVMSAGRSADGREVQIPLQQAAPSSATPLSVAPLLASHCHRSTNPWPPTEPPASQGKCGCALGLGSAAPRPAAHLSASAQVALQASCLFAEASETTL